MYMCVYTHTTTSNSNGSRLAATPKHAVPGPETYVGACQNYGPYFGPDYNTAPSI